MNVYNVEIPDDAKEIDASSTSKQLVKLGAIYEKLKEDGIDIIMIDSRALVKWPAYKCTYFARGAISVLCLCEKILDS